VKPLIKIYTVLYLSLPVASVLIDQKGVHRTLVELGTGRVV